MRMSKSSAHPSVREVLPFAPSMRRVRRVLILADFIRQVFAYDDYLRPLVEDAGHGAVIIYQNVNLSRRSENSASRLVASPNTEAESAASSSARSKEAVSTRRGLRRPTSSFEWGD